MKKTSLLMLFILLAGSIWPGFLSSAATVKEAQSEMPEQEAKVNAPDFPEGLQWLNTDRPLSLRQLRGKIVLLDFWTYCCINCMHILPELKKIEHKYKNEVVVIGVHSAKFQTERDTDNIRQAILRYEIEHPVVNDYAMDVWQEYTVRAWPTLMVIDPAGKLLGRIEGEFRSESLDEFISGLIKKYDAQLDRRPLDLKLERQRMPASVLAFPGKVLADERSKQLFIADSNHNRIVVTSLEDNSVKEVIGSGEIGLKDGDFETAQFNHPQGMAFDGHLLYVADTENHALRAIDFDKRTVTTVAGTGKQSREYTTIGGQGREIALNSPWDVVLDGGMLYIAMAGPHQLWKMNPRTGGIVPYAGTGMERRIDGPLNQAALAQPSGITTDGKKLYFADSEVSSIRSADLDPQGKVETIVGEGLFEFGDRDGRGSQVRLQHPLGVVYHEGSLYVADTYNNKIKRVSPAEKTSETFAGAGKGGFADGDARQAMFDEPGGVSIAFGKLYVADTNNHAIRVVDLKSKRVETLQFKNMEKLRPPMRARQFAGEVIELPAQTIEPGDATITLQLELPAGYKLNAQAPSAVAVTTTQKEVAAINGQPSFRNPQFPLSVPVKVAEGQTTVNVEFTVYYCESAKESLCYFKEARVIAPIVVKRGAGAHKIAATYKLTLEAKR
ncbi:MAG TPA: thioredoxin-like domain-containing protein [Blastocatellia bacterium]|nr:thioredoxin-like domain-containing protein [Blastocatellia bacterium]